MMTDMPPRASEPTALPFTTQQPSPPMETSKHSTPEHTLSEPLETHTGLELGVRHVPPTQEKWDYPRINTWRLAATLFAFIIFGMNDASYGALLPYVCQ